MTYAYVHKGIEHCLVNTTFLLLVGIPLEMVHGGGRELMLSQELVSFIDFTL